MFVITDKECTEQSSVITRAGRLMAVSDDIPKELFMSLCEARERDGLSKTEIVTAAREALQKDEAA